MKNLQSVSAAVPTHGPSKKVFWVVVILIAVGMTIPLVHFRPKNWDSSIIATWAQAYGSVFAIVGSIWIARSEALARSADELDNAMVTARYVAPLLVSIRSSVRRFEFHIQIPYSDEYNPLTKAKIQSLDLKVKEMRSLFSTMTRPTEDQLSRLRVAPVSVQNSILSCMANLVTVDALLQEYFVIYDGHLSSDSRPTLDSIHKMLQEGDQLLRDACNELDKFAGSTELTRTLKKTLDFTESDW